ncbi:VanW family protein [Paenibacillus sp. HB172176]|uniref:VanW family protein n=1 Tax=Paenibacillus sp. HB172176 TaxID=2493690 RepID=UPI001438928C|nr:VanW family protein [Paenibacillus sp. HB172176]
MGWNWLTGLMVLLQLMNPTELLWIDHDGEAIDTVNIREYIQPLPGIPIVDENKLERLMDQAAKKVARAPVDATIDGSGRINPEKNGSELDRQAFRIKFYRRVYEGEAYSKLEVPTKHVYAKVDSEVLSSIKVKEIGQYWTYYNSRNRNRSHNVALAAKAVNNIVVFPGETFSFNKTVGKRTRQKGYLRAPVIVRGELAEDYGGGICQVSSTLFNAADRAGLRIVERYSHSRQVPYVPPGRDATVSWYGPDLVLENPYQQPILIRARASAGEVSVLITSTEMLEFQKREVPSASKKLPPEIRVDDLNVNGLKQHR